MSFSGDESRVWGSLGAWATLEGDLGKVVLRGFPRTEHIILFSRSLSFWYHSKQCDFEKSLLSSLLVSNL